MLNQTLRAISKRVATWGPLLAAIPQRMPARVSPSVVPSLARSIPVLPALSEPTRSIVSPPMRPRSIVMSQARNLMGVG